MIDLSIRHAAGDLDLDVAFRADVRTLALFGDSGAGKTSVLSAIAGLLTPQAGRIALDDRVLFDRASGIDVPVAERRVGYVFQDGRLFPHLDVRANLVYGARTSNGEAVGDFDAIVALLDLGAMLRRMPTTLSGGERQRVAIGRALLARPRALLLDEPLTGLHSEARRQVLAYLTRLRHELRVFTLLVSHHAAEVATLADEVVLLDAGRVAGRLSRTEFASRYAAIVGVA
jgi:molybdate transport system ATP-binding protein